MSCSASTTVVSLIVSNSSDSTAKVIASTPPAANTCCSDWRASSAKPTSGVHRHRHDAAAHTLRRQHEHRGARQHPVAVDREVQRRRCRREGLLGQVVGERVLATGRVEHRGEAHPEQQRRQHHHEHGGDEHADGPLATAAGDRAHRTSSNDSGPRGAGEPGAGAAPDTSDVPTAVAVPAAAAVPVPGTPSTDRYNRRSRMICSTGSVTR